MAETHRRVEPRGLVGTGMLNDPDRLRDNENRYNRFMRDRNLPSKKFNDVMDEREEPGAEQDGTQDGTPEEQAAAEQDRQTGVRPPPGTEWVDAPPPERQRKVVKGPAREVVQDTRFGPRPPPRQAKGRPPPPPPRTPPPAPSAPGGKPNLPPKGTTHKPPPGLKV